MTDINRHSKGYWRSIYVFVSENSREESRTKVEDEIRHHGWKYSYQFYSKNEDEKEHITFRINFPDLKQFSKFSKWLDKEGCEWEDHNYDESPFIKEGYVIGTKLANLIKESLSLDNPLRESLFLIIFHGMFNNLQYTDPEEISIYLYILRNLLARWYKIEDLSLNSSL